MLYQRKHKRKTYLDTKPKRLRETLKRRDNVTEKLRKKCVEKKAKLSKDKFEMEIAKMQAKIDKLTRSENMKKKKIENLQTELKSINRRCTEELKLMETNYQHTILELEEDLAKAKSGSLDEDFNKDGKSYGFKMRVLVYECLVANVPTEQIPGPGVELPTSPLVRTLVKIKAD